MTLTELSERLGITMANLSILKTGKARAIRFTTLQALCATLECQPGDVLTWDGAREAITSRVERLYSVRSTRPRGVGRDGDLARVRGR